MGKSGRRAYLAELSVGERELDAETSRYLISVLRLRTGDDLEFFDGLGGVTQGTILEASKRSVTVALQAITKLPPHLPPIHLYCAIAKGERTEWLIEKCSELAATTISWVIYERSQDHKKDYSKRFERWHKIACEAARQSYNPWVPHLVPPKPFEDVIETLSNESINIVLDTSMPTSPLASLSLHRDQPVSLFIGPEGGFSNTERQLFRKQKWKAVSLGPTVLRIETAAVTGVSAIRNHASISTNSGSS